MKTQSETQILDGASTTIVFKQTGTKLNIQVLIDVGRNGRIKYSDIEVAAFDARGKSLPIKPSEISDQYWTVASTGAASSANGFYEMALKDSSRLDSIAIARGKEKRRFAAKLPVQK